MKDNAITDVQDPDILLKISKEIRVPISSNDL